MAALLLFDIDGTLVSGKAGRRAFARVFAELAGNPHATDGIHFAGKTDVAIFHEILALGRAGDLTVPDLIPTYLRILAEEVRSDPGRLFPGVRELLDALRRQPGIYLALGTGNLEAGARIKLEPHGISHYFPTGGFGDVSIDRKVVIREGIRRSEAHFGRSFDRVVVIGDTPLDVASAVANGARCLAVAQSVYSEEDLLASGATRVVPGFEDVPAALEAIADLAS